MNDIILNKVRVILFYKQILLTFLLIFISNGNSNLMIIFLPPTKSEQILFFVFVPLPSKPKS